MNHLPPRRPSFARRCARGFTLIEIMIVVVIVGVLSAIAIPLYGDYVLRGRIPDATSNLSALAVKMEQAFQDNRSYYKPTTTNCAVDGSTVTSNSFDFSCKATSDTAYVFTAKGKNTMAAFTYSIDQSGVKKTVAVKTGWTAGTNCWTTNKGGC
ncbi:type IV pilin protein [Variovorax sp. EL159]|uniref:type IV pilin protein n=1 Tax=Variovorax sp. EL159 TaxID=1566270 RepID=UPI000884362C|nr:type IV pilin protein [Variovorax sp. EL159]SCX71242.1 type IV pilus assembly protein PilE [Variovorax sp. EL159]